MIVRAVSNCFCLILIHFSFTSAIVSANELSFEGIALTPLSRVAPGGTLVLEARVSNTGSGPAEGTVLITLDDFPKLQSARRIVLERGREQQLDLFVQIPEAARNRKSLGLTATLVKLDGTREVIVERNGSPVRHTLTLSVDSGQSLGLEVRPDPPPLPVWYWPQEAAQTDYEFAIAARIAAGNPRTAATFQERSLPVDDAAWSGTDLFVISKPDVLHDAAAVSSLRRYMSSGGRLWVMLDLVPCAMVRQLLEPDQSCEEVQRVELNDFVVEPLGFMNKFSAEDRRVVSDIDLPMARVLQEGGRVRFTVQGWPAAIEMNIGYGKLILTTLDSRAWIEERLTQSSPDPRFQSAYQPRAWAKAFTVDLNLPKATLPLTEPVEYPLKLIGNPVVPRGWVATVLLGFFAALTGLGLWLAYSGKLSMIGYVAPVAAVLIGVALVGVAKWMRRDMPDSLSRFQMVDISRDGDMAAVREQAAVYLSTSADMQLHGQRDGIVRTSDNISSGVARFTHEDLHDWRLSNAAWPTGSWRYSANYALPTQQLVARASLSSAGLHVQLPANTPSDFGDPVLSFVNGDPMLCERSGDGFNVLNNITVAGERWVAGSFLSDEQQRRLDIYREFFKADSKVDNQVQRPLRTLYGWTAPWDGALWNRELTQRGSALVALPIVLERPEIGAEVLIPHGLIKLQRNLANPAVTSTYDDRLGTWNKRVSSAVEADMQFILPNELVPITASAVELELDIKAPDREVIVSVQTNSGKIELVKLESPSIPWTASITNADVLAAVNSGVLNVQVKVSPSRDRDGNGLASNMILWEIEHFHASVRGKVLAKSSLSAAKGGVQ